MEMEPVSLIELCEDLVERAPEELNEETKMWVVHTVRDVVETSVKISACKTEHRKDYIKTVVFLICFVLLFLGCFVGVWFPNPSMNELLKIGLFSTFALIINKLGGTSLGNTLGNKMVSSPATTTSFLPTDYLDGRIVRSKKRTEKQNP